MEELFNILSSSARIDKSKRAKNQVKKSRSLFDSASTAASAANVDGVYDEINEEEDGAARDHDDDDDDDDGTKPHAEGAASRDRTGKRDTSDAKRAQVHKEQMAAFRRSMSIRVADANKHDPDLPDPISSFEELHAPKWCSNGSDTTQQIITPILNAMRNNIERGRWKEPTAIQMQSIPTLLKRRDYIGAAPTGSGKSGAFIIPALVLSSVPYNVFYNTESGASDDADGSNSNKKLSKKHKKKKKSNQKEKSNDLSKFAREGEVRSLILAPSRELAVQLHREVERIGTGKPGGLSAMLLSKSNAAHVLAGTAGGKHGLDVLVTTPLRLVDAIEKGLKLDAVRLVVLDEADRLLDAADGGSKDKNKMRVDSSFGEGSSDDENDDDDSKDNANLAQSGSNQTQAFLAQIDSILSAVPVTAVRALFSATVTTKVHSLAESILRNPVDVRIAAPGTMDGGANSDIEQELMFVGREDGKLLAIRQLAARGQLRPPAIVFAQSKERAQALFAELLYDDLRVDVIHAGRSRTARDAAVAKFRRGETWILICTDLVARGVDFRAANMVINYDLPESGIAYVHRIGRTGRAGRKGKAITLFTEADFDNLRTIANVMKQSGCKVEDWMLQLRKKPKNAPTKKRPAIDTTAIYDKRKRRKRQQMIKNSKEKKNKTQGGGNT